MPKLYSTAFWLNGLFLLLMIILVIYAKMVGLSAKELFLHPKIYSHITISSLTYLFQMLCSVPPIVCLFTYHLLSQTGSQSPEFRRFLLASIGITGGFLFNEIYRIHIYLSVAGIDKPIVIGCYAILLLAYIIGCRKLIRSTPYPLLLMGIGILLIGIGIDALRLPDQGTTNFLEGVPKVLSQVNIAYYFWCICLQAIQKSRFSSF